MSPLELLAPEGLDAVPFSVRLAERRLPGRAVTRNDRRAHLRRSAADLEWLRGVRLIGGTGYDVTLVDLSEGGALLEVDAPLRPGVVLTLELSGPGVEAAVPIEVLRCHISTLRGETTVYRGACVFAHLIELPGTTSRPVPPVPGFVGADAALKHLLERSVAAPDASSGLSLARAEVIQVLAAVQIRTAGRGADLLSRYTSDLLSAVLPALRGDSSREVVTAAFESRLRAMPHRWRAQLEPTIARLAALIDHCSIAATPPVTPALVGAAESARATAPSAPAPMTEPTEGGAIVLTDQVKTAFQKIVVRYNDGRILKGHVQDFHPSRPQFSLWPSVNATPKERVIVPVARLKAVFFVRDFMGNPDYRGPKAPTPRGQGRRVEVTFNDGECLTGTTLNYRPDGQGFFVSPADPADNNTRIFVVAAALRRVRFL